MKSVYLSAWLLVGAACSCVQTKPAGTIQPSAGPVDHELEQAYDVARKRFDQEAAAAKRQLEADLAAQKMDPDEAHDRYETRMDYAIGILVGGGLLGCMDRFLNEPTDYRDRSALDRQIRALAVKTQILASVKQQGRTFVTELLSRQDRPPKVPPSGARVRRFGSNPAESFRLFCGDFIRATASYIQPLSDVYGVDLKHTENLSSPYIGTLEASETKNPANQWRFTISPRNGRWMITRIEERIDPSASTGATGERRDWEDTADSTSVHRFISAARAISNP